MYPSEEAVVARCSPFAADYLKQMNSHALYPEILACLSEISGELHQLDVEEVFLRVTEAKHHG